MIVLNDSTAKSIAKAIESLNSDDRRFIGITIDEQDEWVAALETPLPEGYGCCHKCRHAKEYENVHCSACMDSMAFAVAIGWEAKS